MKCPNCGKENKNTNIRCESCSIELIDINQFNRQGIFNSNSSKTKILTKIIVCLVIILILILFVPFFLGGTLLFWIAFSSNQTEGYEKTTAVLKDYTNCTYDDGEELCEAVYEYQVNGITYKISSGSINSRDEFDENKIVYYKPNNSSEFLMDSSRNSLILNTIITLVVTVVIVVGIVLLVKTIIKKYTPKDVNNTH